MITTLGMEHLQPWDRMQTAHCHQFQNTHTYIHTYRHTYIYIYSYACHDLSLFDLSPRLGFFASLVQSKNLKTSYPELRGVFLPLSFFGRFCFEGPQLALPLYLEVLRSILEARNGRGESPLCLATLGTSSRHPPIRSVRSAPGWLNLPRQVPLTTRTHALFPVFVQAPLPWLRGDAPRRGFGLGGLSGMSECFLLNGVVVLSRPLQIREPVTTKAGFPACLA